MNQDATTKIRMIKQSLRCLTLGLLSLLPFIGVFFAPFALIVSLFVRRQEKKFWNPAMPHRLFGLVFAALGLLVWSVVDSIVIWNIIHEYLRDHSNDFDNRFMQRGFFYW